MTPAYGPALERYVCAHQALERTRPGDEGRVDRILEVVEARRKFRLAMPGLLKNSIAEIKDRLKNG